MTNIHNQLLGISDQHLAARTIHKVQVTPRPGHLATVFKVRDSFGFRSEGVQIDFLLFKNHCHCQEWRHQLNYLCTMIIGCPLTHLPPTSEDIVGLPSLPIPPISHHNCNSGSRPQSCPQKVILLQYKVDKKDAIHLKKNRVKSMGVSVSL